MKITKIKNKINIVGNALPRIDVADKPMRRIDPEEFGKAIGASECIQVEGKLDLIDLVEIGKQILEKRQVQNEDVSNSNKIT